MTMTASIRLLGVIALSVSITGCATSDLQPSDLAYFQPDIVSTEVRPLGSYSMYHNTVHIGLSEMKPIVPSFNGNGNLIASWNPHPAGIQGRPTIVIVHGGHGIGPTDFATAAWAAKELNANTLVLDSYWSRGIQENWRTQTRFGVDMRALDSIAAGKWLQAQGVDQQKIFLMGGSQGGWTVLRTFTQTPFMEKNAKGIYRAGISLYPNCNSKGMRDDPSLGPYWGKVIVFTGGKDTATPPSACPSRVFTDATSWIHYPEATHGWDVANRGAHTSAVDGDCGRALNVYNRFSVCRSDSVTADMYEKIKAFVADVTR